MVRIFAVVATLACALFVEGAVYQGTLRNYICSKCSTLICAPKPPSGGRCSAGILHEWVDLGEVGADVYQCEKCSIMLRSKKYPRPSWCSSGGLHKWSKF